MSDEPKTEEIENLPEEVSAQETDIAATEIESQIVVETSDQVASSADIGESGVAENAPTVETAEVVESVTTGDGNVGDVAETIDNSDAAKRNETESDPVPVAEESVEIAKSDENENEPVSATVESGETAQSAENEIEPAPVSVEASVEKPSAEAAEIVSDIAATEIVTNESKENDDDQAKDEIVTETTVAAAVEITVPGVEQTTETLPPADLPQTTASGETEVVKPPETSVTEEITTERSDFPDAVQAEGIQAPPEPVIEDNIEAADDKDATATVKFLLQPTKQVVTIALSINQSMQQIKEQLSNEVKVPADVLQLAHGDNSLSDSLTLKDLNVPPNGAIELDVTSINPVESPLRTSQPKPEFGSSDVITVRLMKENNDYEDVVVEIDRSYRRKPFLGGFRHKITGVEYHHASAQTMPKPLLPSKIPKNCRDTQTVFESNRRTQTTNTTSTQMTKTGCYVSVAEDKIIHAKKYFTSEEYFERRLKAVIVLQSYFRRWQARHIVDELRHDRDRRLQWEEQEELRKRREKEMRIKSEFERRMNPKTKEDFDLVYSALEKWRLEELQQIDAELDGPERKAALCALLDQEAQLIASIGRHKLEASKDNKEKNVERFLGKAASPKRWKAYDGRYTEMDTQYTIRAREMKDIYNSINMKFLTQDERLDILLTLKHTVKEHDCKLTRDIIELIDREADLLMRGVSDANLEGLRTRISTLFLQYCKNPLFNPEIARLLKVPQDPSTLRKDIYFCNSTNQYLPSTEFKIVSNARTVGKSRKVQETDNIARTRQDYSHYRIMLRDLRRSEESQGDDSKISYLIQEKELQYLIENIWSSQSILSAWDDLFDLVLVRWDKNEEWSPWNCILLTKDEALAHSRIDHLYEAYGQVFIKKVKQKHTLARIYFSKIQGMSEQLRRKISGSQKLSGPSEIVGTRAMSMT